MRLSRRRLLDYSVAAPILASISACQLVSYGPPPRAFRLTPKSTFSEPISTVSWSLGVGLPSADRSVDTTRIVRLADGIELEYYADAAWANRPTRMIQTLILQSFQNSDAIDIVVDDRSDVRPEFVLRTDLQEFQAEQTDVGPPQVRVALDAKLLRMPKRDVIGSETFDQMIVATGDNIEAIITTFDQALGEVLKDLVEWTLSTGEVTMS